MKDCVTIVVRNGVAYDARDYGYRCWPIGFGKGKRKSSQRIKRKSSFVKKI